MFKLNHLFLQRGGHPLFEDLTLTFHAGQKVGITGANGTGKSTLFSLLRGEIHPDAGDVDIPSGLAIAHVEQEIPALVVPAIEYVIDGDTELRAIEKQLDESQQSGDGARIAQLHASFDAIDGYTARTRAAQLLHGLGFAADAHVKPVLAFSGGWQQRLNLARALMRRSDLLLLDEPTNHLDLDAVLWLEEWLRGYGGTLLLISHDRDFLDKVVGVIAHIERRKMETYKGNYTQFERQRGERLALQQASYEKQQRQIAHIQSFVARFRAKATKARQAQSRLKVLSRIQTIAAAHVDSPFQFAFKEPVTCPNPLLRLEACSAGYGEAIILRNIDLNLEPGTRLGLLGRNGAGKSTLIKLLAGEIEPRLGERLQGQGLAIGYFAQHQLEQLRPEASPLQHLQQIASQAGEQELRNFLGGFGFAGDNALRAVAPFSGGEKARLALALLIWQRPNLLLLDEPTNHLDLDMRHALTLALQDYQGALVVVSHDRHLLHTTTDSLALVAENRLTGFDGDLDDYSRWLIQYRSAQSGAEKTLQLTTAERRLQKRAEAEQRNRLAEQRRPLQGRLNEIERRMSKLNDEKKSLEALLADPAVYQGNNKNCLKETLIKQAQLAATLQRNEEAWLEISESLETLSK